MKRSHIALGLLLAITPILAAVPIRPEITGEESAATDTLIADLRGEVAFARRESAANILIELGPVARDRLAAAVKSSNDEEQRTRIESILKRITDEAITGPTRVTIRGDEISAMDAIESVSRQSQVRIHVFPTDLWQRGAAPPVKIEATRQPFWIVVQALCEQLALDPAVIDDGVRLAPSTGCGLTRGPTVVAGPLLIAAARISHQRAIEFTQSGVQVDDFMAGFNVLAEPKLRIMPGPIGVEITTAEDDAGNSLLLDDESDTSYGSGGSTWSFVVRLRYPPAPGRSISRLGGTITLPVATSFASLTVDDVVAAAELLPPPVPEPDQMARHDDSSDNGEGDGEENKLATETALARCETDDFTFLIRRIVRNGERWEIAVAASSPRGRGDDFGRLQQILYSPDIRLLDADGNAIVRASGPAFTSARQPNTLEMTLLFDRSLSDGRPLAGTPRSLVWKIPTKTKAIAIPFEFKNLPMP